MLAALAIAVTLPKVGIHFGGMDLGQFIVMFLGGMIGVILMRFAATWFVELLNKYPGLGRCCVCNCRLQVLNLL